MTLTPDTVTRVPRNAELEASLEAYFRRAVRMSLGGLCIKLAPTEKGVPDRLVVLPGGRVMLVELKTVYGRLSPMQEHLHAKLAQLGTDVVVLWGRPGIDAWVRAQFPTDTQLRQQAKDAKAARAAAK